MKSVAPKLNWRKSYCSSRRREGPFGSRNRNCHTKSTHTQPIDLQAHQFFEQIRVQKNISQLEEFYNLRSTELRRHAGSKELFRKYKNLGECLKAAYPDHEWLPWKFGNVPRGFWSDSANKKAFMTWLLSKLQFRIEDCYNLTKATIAEHGGGGLLSLYSGSPAKLVMSVFPEHAWEEWRFNVPPDYWTKPANCRAVFESFAKQSNLKSLDDWYNVKQRDFVKFGGRSLLSAYKDSLANALMAAYPEFNWEPWKFKSLPKGWLDEEINQRHYLEALMRKLNMTQLSDLYKLSTKDVIDNGGEVLIRKYSLVGMVMKLFPEHEWKPWKFVQAPHGWWDVPENRIRFLKDLETTLGITKLEDWYKVTPAQIREHRGHTLLARWGLYESLVEAYPNHEWYEWKFFGRARPNFWTQASSTNRDFKDLRHLLEQVAEKLGITKLSGWYRVSTKDIPRGAYEVILRFGGLASALQKAFPEHKWDTAKLASRFKSSEQAQIYQLVEATFGNNATVYEKHTLR